MTAPRPARVPGRSRRETLGICYGGGMASHDDTTKVPHNVEIPLSLKNRVKKYARDSGISQTAATTLLLDSALTAAGYPRRGK